jgi:aminoglycoside phosphotransferase (APT) family kinase protein
MTEQNDAAVRVASWLLAQGARIEPGAARLHQVAGGNSNISLLLTDGVRRLMVRRPPAHGLDRTAHKMSREWELLSALNGRDVPIAKPVAYCPDPAILGAEFIVTSYLADSVSMTEHLPEAYEGKPEALKAIGFGMIEALAAVQSVDWRAAGLSQFGKPDGFLQRQVPRWQAQFRRNQVRDLPAVDTVAGWLQHALPPVQQPAIIHGDFHLDNCLFSRHSPRLLAVIDWEMASIGDPLLDLGLMLALWGPRAADPPAVRRIQAVSRLPGSPSREDLATRYSTATGRETSHICWYQVLALWKLACIVEAAWAQHTRGELNSEYSASLEQDVPTLLEEAVSLAGL